MSHPDHAPTLCPYCRGAGKTLVAGLGTAPGISTCFICSGKGWAPSDEIEQKLLEVDREFQTFIRRVIFALVSLFVAFGAYLVFLIEYFR